MSDPYQIPPQHAPAMAPYPNAGYGRVTGFRSVPANWGWAVAACVFFWPIGFSAVSAAGRVLPALLDGDVHAAMADSAKARRLGIIALCILAALFALYVVFIVVIIGLTSSSCDAGSC